MDQQRNQSQYMIYKLVMNYNFDHSGNPFSNPGNKKFLGIPKFHNQSNAHLPNNSDLQVYAIKHEKMDWKYLLVN